MATTTFSPRSSLRASQQQSSQESAHPLPSVDFSFDSLRRTMSTFSTHFDEYIETGRRTALSSRNAHRTRLSELSGDGQLKTRSIGILRTAAASHAGLIAKESAERAEMDGAIAQLTGARDAAGRAAEGIRAEAERTRAAIEKLETAQREYAERVAAQARLNAPELAFYEDFLGLRIESPADDEIAFVFCCVDDRDPEREFVVSLDLARRDYAIKSCRPSLDGNDVGRGSGRERLRGALERLNEGRELAPFLKEVRGLCQAKVREERG